MKKYQLILISLLSGVLLSLAWPSYGFSPVLFIALIPFLWIEDYISNNRDRFSRYSVFTYAIPGLFLWNIITTYWINYATFFGLFAPILNSLLFAFVLQSYSFFKRVLFDNRHSLLLLPIIWISAEYIHHHWEFTWPWMTLGNGFSEYTSLVQWYEYTGVFGGSLWIILANYFGFRAIKFYQNNRKAMIKHLVYFSSIIFLPILVSLIIGSKFVEEDNEPVNVLVIQPNLEPYDEAKMLSNNQILERLINMADSKIDNNTDFILCPEGCLEERIWEDALDNSYSLYRLSEYLKNYPNSEWLVGSFTAKLQDESEKTEASRPITHAPKPYYSLYNSAVQIRKDDDFNVYHKKKLVPGVERMPFYKYVKKVLDFAISLGNLPVGTLGVDNNQPLIIHNSNDSIKAIMGICYESVYGEFLARKAQEGGSMIFIITNDSWWSDTQGYKQHASYARLRAIETRRYIARSANTGTSMFIDPMGRVMEKTEFWVPDTIKESIKPQYKTTFYAKHGDYIARISLLTALILGLVSFVKNIINKTKD